MNTWIGSDFHFGHTNIMKFCPDTRGHFRDVDHMNAEMIREWNQLVDPADTVYMLGDIAFTSADKAAGIVNSLNGRKILIKGNHDSKTIKDKRFTSCFDEIHDYLDITFNGYHVVMFHYPICEWNRMHHGAVHLYGHLHQNKSGLEQYRARNVGWDYTGRLLTRMEDMVSDALKGAIKSHHNKVV